MYFIPLYLWKRDNSHFDYDFIETRHLGLEQEIRQCNQEKTNLKQDPLQL